MFGCARVGDDSCAGCPRRMRLIKTNGEEGMERFINPGGSAGTFGAIGKATGESIQPGSGIAFSRPLENSGKKTEGDLNVACIATQVPKKVVGGSCTATAKVPGGTFALNVGGKGNSRRRRLRCHRRRNWQVQRGSW
jgi:hypothetical protein